MFQNLAMLTGILHYKVLNSYLLVLRISIVLFLDILVMKHRLKHPAGMSDGPDICKFLINVFQWTCITTNTFDSIIIRHNYIQRSNELWYV